MTDSYLYDSFGNDLITGSTINPFRYVGELGYYFEADLSVYYLRARFYDPASGRFMSADDRDSGDVMYVGPYCYSYNRPNQIVDPSGFQPPLTLADCVALRTRCNLNNLGNIGLCCGKLGASIGVTTTLLRAFCNKYYRGNPACVYAFAAAGVIFIGASGALRLPPARTRAAACDAAFAACEAAVDQNAV